VDPIRPAQAFLAFCAIASSPAGSMRYFLTFSKKCFLNFATFGFTTKAQ
jgi:hypothetical protein